MTSTSRPAVAKSPSALSTHSLARGFIKDLTVRHDIRNEGVAQREAFLDLLGRSDNDVHREVRFDAPSHFGSLAARVPGKSHYHEHVGVRIWTGCAARE